MKNRGNLYKESKDIRNQYFGIKNAFIKTYCHVKQVSHLVASNVKTDFRTLKNSIRWHSSTSVRVLT